MGDADLEEFDRRLSETADSMDPTARRALLQVLSVEDDEERARLIGRLHSSEIAPKTVQLLIDIHDDPSLRRLLVIELERASLQQERHQV